MSLPDVLPRSCRPVPGLAPLPEAAGDSGAGEPSGSPPAEPSEPAGSAPPTPTSDDGRPALPQPGSPRLAARGSAMGPAVGSLTGPVLGAGSLPARALLLLGLLQLVLGCALVALNFGALSLSSDPLLKSTCPFWTGSSVILCGILGIMTWKKPMAFLANFFVLLSIICVLLSMTGLILGCQGILFVSSVPRCDWVNAGKDKICLCCKEINLTKCTEEETLLKLYHLKSCSAAHFLLKKVLFAICALNAITTTVCLVAAALPYLWSFATRRSCRGEPRVEDEDDVLDLDDFVAPVPPPSYFETLYSSALEMSHRARIKGIKAFCPPDPPPPYEGVQSQNSSEQRGAVQISVEEDFDWDEISAEQASQGEEVSEPSSRVSLSPSDGSQMSAEGACVPVFNPLQKRSESEPVLHCQLLKGAVLSSEPAIPTEVKASLCGVTLRKSSRRRDLRERAQSLVDYRSYKDTKQLVAWILEQSSCSMNPDINEVVGSIKSVLKSDEKRMAEAITSATFLEQAMAPAQQAHVLPFRQYSGLLHLETCGDLSISTTDEDWLAERRIQRAERERPHSHIGIVRETAL